VVITGASQGIVANLGTLNKELTMTALPSPQLRHLYRVDANLDAPVDLGQAPEGHRRIIAWTGGRAEGPDLHAEVLGTGGADWQIVRPSGSSVADIRYTLKTDRGGRVAATGLVARAAALWLESEGFVEPVVHPLL
jgi:hypothetical protein